MKRVIFDTNVYGDLFQEKDYQDLSKRILSDKSFVIYGYPPIRKEIRNIPKVTKFSISARNALLNLYDSLTGKHILKDRPQIIDLAKKYHATYRIEGGIYGWKTGIQTDFKIVACASVNSLDLVCTGDNKTLMSRPALKAYLKINSEHGIKTPDLLKYKHLLEKLRSFR